MNSTLSNYFKQNYFKQNYFKQNYFKQNYFKQNYLLFVYQENLAKTIMMDYFVVHVHFNFLIFLLFGFFSNLFWSFIVYIGFALGQKKSCLITLYTCFGFSVIFIIMNTLFYLIYLNCFEIYLTFNGTLIVFFLFFTILYFLKNNL